MKHYAVKYFDGDSTDWALADDDAQTFFFLCQAENTEHCEEQFYNAYPDYTILCVYRDVY